MSDNFTNEHLDIADQIPGKKRIQLGENGQLRMDVEIDEYENFNLIEMVGLYHYNKNLVETEESMKQVSGIVKGGAEFTNSLINTPLAILNEATMGGIEFLDSYLEEDPLRDRINEIMPDENVSLITKELTRFGLSYGSGVGIASKFKGLRVFLKAIISEVIGGALYYDKGDANLADSIGIFFDLDKSESNKYVKEALLWAKSDEDDNMFMSKMKGVVSDTALLLSGGLVLKSLIYTPRMIKEFIQNPALMEDVAKSVGLGTGIGIATSPTEKEQK
jgi:hypothetical protein